MAMDFAYSGPRSYRAHLAGLHQREKIDVAVATRVRAVLGSIAEIYGGKNPVLQEALRDFRYPRPGESFETLTLHLHYACTAADPVAGGLADGFHLLFDDEAARHRPRASGEAEPLIAKIAALTARQQFGEALRFVNAVLVEYPALCAQDLCFERLRAALLAGVPGQPKSAQLVDLPAAERAWFNLALKAGRERPAEAAAAFVGAGKCAYAAGRLTDAERHYCAALDRAPRSGEANYQMARLRMHEGNQRAVRDFLILAFQAHFCFALRAAGDALFRGDVALVRSCAIAATRRTAHEMKVELARFLAALKFLAHNSDHDHPADQLAGFASTRAEIARLAGQRAATTLKHVLSQKKEADAQWPPVARLAGDYCALLRAQEEQIVRRGIAPRRRVDAERVARWLTRAAEVSVAAALIGVVAGMFDYAAAAPMLDWQVTASVSAFGVGMATLWLMLYTSRLRRPTRNFFERVVLAVQARAQARAERAIPKRIARNRARLRKRIRRIERYFGLVNS